jgi:hypothetical protein
LPVADVETASVYRSGFLLTKLAMLRLEKIGFQRPKKKQLNEYRKPDVQTEPKIVLF